MELEENIIYLQNVNYSKYIEIGIINFLINS